MRTIFGLTFLAGLFAGSATAQSFIQWQKTLGGDGNDILQSVWQTADSGYIAGGYSYSSLSGDKTEDTLGGFDYWVMKLDSTGMLQWQNTIGGDRDDYLEAVQQTADGGYILGGYSLSDSTVDKTADAIGEYDYWVVKLDPAGLIKWQVTLGGDSSDYLYSLVQTDDGGYFLGGSSNSGVSGSKTDSSYGEFDYWVLKLDSLGTVQWQRTLGGDGFDWLRSARQTADGGFILGGYSDSDSSDVKSENGMGLSDYWVVKLDATGNVEWENTIGGADYDLLYAVCQTADQGYLLGGNSSSGISPDKSEDVIGLDDFWVVKLDSLGVIEWDNTIGGFGTDRARTVAQAPNGEYFVGGFSNSGLGADKSENSNGGYDFWLMQLDSAGAITWQKTLGGFDWEELYAACYTPNGPVLGGYSRSGISGDKTGANQGLFDYWLVKVYQTPLVGIGPAASLPVQLTLFPNPASTWIQIGVGGIPMTGGRVVVADLAGRTVLDVAGQDSRGVLNIASLQPGIYLLTVQEGSSARGVGRFVKE